METNPRWFLSFEILGAKILKNKVGSFTEDKEMDWCIKALDSIYGHTVLHNDPVVPAKMCLAKNATSSIRGSKLTATRVMTGEGPRCTAVTKKYTHKIHSSTK